MKKFAGILLLFLYSCAGKCSIPINQLGYSNLFFTPVYNFKVMLKGQDKESIINILEEIDTRWGDFQSCIMNTIGINVNTNRAKEYRYYILSDYWRCPYHDWCFGEVCTSEKRVGISQRGLTEKALEHEWAHVYKFLNSKDKLRSNSYLPATSCFYWDKDKNNPQPNSSVSFHISAHRHHLSTGFNHGNSKSELGVVRSFPFALENSGKY